jgi:hypothetical protein
MFGLPLATTAIFTFFHRRRVNPSRRWPSVCPPGGWVARPGRIASKQKGNTMTKDQIIKEFAEQKDLTFDVAIPQEFYENMRRFGVNPSEFVWAYDETNRIFGKPVSLSHFFLLALEKGNLVPFDVIENIVDMAREKDSKGAYAYSPAELQELTKLHCQSL